MKKLTLILVLFFVLFSIQQATAGITIGGFGGYNLLLKDYSFQDATKGGVCFGGKVGFTMPVITAGLIVGYFPIYHYSYSATILGTTGSYEGTSYVVPVLGFAQLDLGPLYLLGGLGLYSTKTKTTITVGSLTGSTDTTDSSSDFGFALGAGLKFGLPAAPLNFEVGGLFQQITGKSDVTTSMFSFLAGVNLKFF